MAKIGSTLFSCTTFHFACVHGQMEPWGLDTRNRYSTLEIPKVSDVVGPKKLIS